MSIVYWTSLRIFDLYTVFFCHFTLPITCIWNSGKYGFGIQAKTVINQYKLNLFDLDVRIYSFSFWEVLKVFWIFIFNYSSFLELMKSTPGRWFFLYWYWMCTYCFIRIVCNIFCHCTIFIGFLTLYILFQFIKYQRRTRRNINPSSKFLL